MAYHSSMYIIMSSALALPSVHVHVLYVGMMTPTLMVQNLLNKITSTL